MFMRFLKDESGASAVEYGLIVVVLSLAIIAGVERVSNQLEWLWGNNNSRLNQAFQ